MPEPLTLRVCALYPDLMNIYADRGNLLVLRRRCEWRGIEFSLSGAGIGEDLDPAGADLFYMGGGQDRDQVLCAQDLHERKRRGLVQAVADGAVVLGVCGGYQLLGHAYEIGEQELPGVGLLDLRTVRSDAERLIGNVAIRVELAGAEGRVLAGFENHGGRTFLGSRAQALGQVLSGGGNNGTDGSEGAFSGTVVGTYLHGPLLPKNAWFADWLIATSLGVELEALAPLDDELEQLAHHDACAVAGL